MENTVLFFPEEIMSIFCLACSYCFKKEDVL